MIHSFPIVQYLSSLEYFIFLVLTYLFKKRVTAGIELQEQKWNKLLANEKY